MNTQIRLHDKPFQWYKMHLGRCTPGWYWEANFSRCYFFSNLNENDTFVNWTTSNELCIQYDPYGEAKLTPIHTKDESDFIYNKINHDIGNYIWIGGYLDRVTEKNEIWR